MAERKPAPWVKTALDYGPILLFFVAYMLLKDREFLIAGTAYSGFIIVTALFVPLLALSTFLLWRLTGTLSKMQVMTLVLVVVFGGLTVWLNDERFFKMKPTLIYLIFAVLLLVGLLTGRSWLRMVLAEAVPLTDEGWRILTWRVCLFFFGLAAANEVVWRSFSTETWVSFKTFGLPALIFVFFLVHAKFFDTYGDKETDA